MTILLLKYEAVVYTCREDVVTQSTLLDYSSSECSRAQGSSPEIPRMHILSGS